MSENHTFNTSFAKIYGIEEAIIFNDLYYWCLHNKNNGINCHISEKEPEDTRKPRFWTYNTYESFSKKYEYLNKTKICRIIKNLEEKGLIMSDEFNTNKYDRTKWYAITDFGEKEFVRCYSNISNRLDNNDSLDVTNLQNGSEQSEPTIPTSYTDTKQNSLPNSEGSSFSEPEFSEIFPTNTSEKESVRNVKFYKNKKSNESLERYFNKITEENKSIAESIVSLIELHRKKVEPKFHFTNNQKGNEIYTILEHSRKSGVELSDMKLILESALSDSWWGDKIDSAKFFTNNYSKLGSKFASKINIQIQKGKPAFEDKERDYSKDEGAW